MSAKSLSGHLDNTEFTHDYILLSTLKVLKADKECNETSSSDKLIPGLCYICQSPSSILSKLNSCPK